TQFTIKDRLEPETHTRHDGKYTVDSIGRSCELIAAVARVLIITVERSIRSGKVGIKILCEVVISDKESADSITPIPASKNVLCHVQVETSDQVKSCGHIVVHIHVD